MKEGNGRLCQSGCSVCFSCVCVHIKATVPVSCSHHRLFFHHSSKSACAAFHMRLPDLWMTFGAIAKRRHMASKDIIFLDMLVPFERGSKLAPNWQLTRLLSISVAESCGFTGIAPFGKSLLATTCRLEAIALRVEAIAISFTGATSTAGDFRRFSRMAASGWRFATGLIEHLGGAKPGVW